jgi:hypothetical protein
MMKKCVLITVLFTFVLLAFSPAAQSQSSRSNKWQVSATPYFWFVDWDGELTNNGITRPLDTTISEAFDEFSFGATLRVEARKRQWAGFFDVNYKNMAPDRGNAIADIYMWLLEAGAAYQLTEQFEAIGGFRAFSTDINVKVDGILVSETDKSWLDPIIGARFTWEFRPGWSSVTKADVGGFGVGSDFSWNAQTAVGYRAGGVSFWAGYRIWDVDYSSGSGAELFEYDVTTSGFGLGLTFHFDE